MKKAITAAIVTRRFTFHDLRDYYATQHKRTDGCVAVHLALPREHHPSSLCATVSWGDGGLVASVTFGGRPAQGEGFSIILIARYVLETCSRVSDAVDALCRIPAALSQSVTVLDKNGAYATVYLTPGRVPSVSHTPDCTNHQEPFDFASGGVALYRTANCSASSS